MKAVTCSHGPVIAAGWEADDGLHVVAVVPPHVAVAAPDVAVVGLVEDRLEGQHRGSAHPATVPSEADVLTDRTTLLHNRLVLIILWTKKTNIEPRKGYIN